MPPTLHTSITALAQSFADAVLDAVRGANLEEILELSNGGKASRGGRGRAQATPAGRTSSGRLRRRSPAEIANLLQDVVSLVKRNKGGLRSEQIRQTLGMEAKEMPRVLKEGLAKKVLQSKGVKRSTTYTAA